MTFLEYFDLQVFTESCHLRRTPRAECTELLMHQLCAFLLLLHHEPIVREREFTDCDEQYFAIVGITDVVVSSLVTILSVFKGN